MARSKFRPFAAPKRPVRLEDTSTLVIDADLEAFFHDVTLAPDENGCELHRVGEVLNKITVVPTVDGQTKAISTLRAAWVLWTGEHLGAHQDVGHVCGNTGTDGKPLCVAPDHLTLMTARDRILRAGRKLRLKAAAKRLHAAGKIAMPVPPRLVKRA